MIHRTEVLSAYTIINDLCFSSASTRFDPSNALLLGQAAALSYRPVQQVREQLPVWGLPRSTTLIADEMEGIVDANDSVFVVAFRGTEPTKLQDWVTNTQVRLVEGPVGMVHEGFSRALEVVRP